MSTTEGCPTGVSQTIDLQGVAAFVGLVELLAQELGSTPGRIQGMLPNGPKSFEELIGEISMNSQGFQRHLSLMVKPGSALKLHFRSAWRESQSPNDTGSTIAGVEADYFLDRSVEEIAPQGRALARHVEDVFQVMDRMVTLGHSGRLATMSVSASELEAFEKDQAETLVSNSWSKKAESFDPVKK